MTNENIPFQVQNLIKALLNSQDNVHLRANYRMRLDAIQAEINTALRKYDNEVVMSGNKRGKRA